MSSILTETERLVLNAILEGPGHNLKVLRQQFETAKASGRTASGAGFYTTIELPPGVERLPTRGPLQLDDVGAEIEGLTHGAGFILYVRDGAIECLEGFTYDESWPADARVTKITYLFPARRFPAELDAPTNQ